jgi:hypothetical protein
MAKGTANCYDRCKAFQGLVISGFPVRQLRRDGEFGLRFNIEAEVSPVSEQDADFVSGTGWPEFNRFHLLGRDFRKVRLCASLEVECTLLGKGRVSPRCASRREGAR